MLVHFHADGTVCPSSFGQICPEDTDWDGSLTGDPYEGHVTMDMFAAASKINGLSGPHGMAAAFGGLGGSNGMANPMAALSAMTGMGGGGDDDPSAGMMNMVMATMLSAAVSSAADPESAKLDDPMSNPAMAMMAAMASSMPSVTVDNVDGENANGSMNRPPPNPFMQMMAAMAGAALPPSSTASDAPKSDPSAGQIGFQPQLMFQRQMKTMMNNIQIQKTVSNSAVFNKLTDEEVVEMSEGQFTSSKEFVAFMQNPATEVAIH